MNELSTQLEGVTTETTALLHKTNELALDIQQKAEQLNTVVEAVRGVGSTVDGLNTSVQRVSNSIVHEAERNSDKIAQIVQWSNVVMGIYDKVKDRKNGDSDGWTLYAPSANSKRVPSTKSY